MSRKSFDNVTCLIVAFKDLLKNNITKNNEEKNDEKRKFSGNFEVGEKEEKLVNGKVKNYLN